MSGATRTAAKGLRKRRKALQRALRASQQASGLKPRCHTTRPNRSSPYQTVQQERQARTEATLEHARVLRAKLPVLLRQLSQIPDPRNPLLITHKLTCLMIYGILMFVLQTGSRRKTNETLTAPAMKNQLLRLFPDLQTLPHHDTLYRLLACIEVDRIEEAQVEVVRSLIRDKKLASSLIEGRYAIAIDGTQKLRRKQLPATQWLQREVGSPERKKPQYYVYVLEANLVLPDGIALPLMSEFLDYTKGDSEREKQDCEQRAFYRLAKRLKEAFPHLPIVVLLDGMFAIGPVMQLCRAYHWHYLIVLQDGSLPQVWEEYRGLKRLLSNEEQHLQLWGDRRQQFHWVNDIQYGWGPNERKTLTVHLAVCEEGWKEVDENAKVVKRHCRYAWISDLPFSKNTIHQRCNLGARHRWTIEEGILVEKHQGYHYEHCYAYNWNAMRGYHYLMRIGHLLNVLAACSVKLVKVVKERGPQGFIEFVRGTLSGLWLESEEVKGRLSEPFQLRLLPRSHLPPIVL